MKRASRLLTFSFICVGLLAGATASASEEFPPIIATTVGASGDPPCVVCHATEAGGVGTAVTPFAFYMRSRGLTKDNTASLRRALAAMIGERHDTDRDGQTDADELKAGENPNGVVASDVPPIEYGCGRVATRAPSDDGLVWLSLGLAAIVIGRRGRRRN